MKTLKVIGNWYSDSGDAQIIQIAPLDEHRELRNDLFWYSGDARPFWQLGDLLSDTEVLATKCYKQRKFVSIDHDIPNDCYQPL